MMLTRTVPPEVRAAFEESDGYFPSQLQKFQFYDKYSRYSHDLGRRETWVEAVDRVVNYLFDLSEGKLDKEVYDTIRQYILEMKVMPSMRLLAMAGPAAKRNNAVLYNCAYLPVDRLDSFVEALHISMSGCGVGFSVESQYVNQLPKVKTATGIRHPTHTVADSSEGWEAALRSGLVAWFNGDDIDFDFSLVRPAGAPLLTKGGRASGPEPLKKLLSLARDRIYARQGQELRPIDAHDIMCMIGAAAVSGGVRRTAMISLFDYDDEAMRRCKDGDFYLKNPQRWTANNSAVWPERELSMLEVAKHFVHMAEGGNGEPGIFSRRAAKLGIPKRRKEATFGVNPCGEIILRPRQFCNLTSVVARPEDDYFTLAEKVKVAAIIGTIQSMATHFPGLSDEWRRNCEEERLLGVDLNGQMDSPMARISYVQEKLRDLAVKTNAHYANILGINASASVTCVKPSGNSSQLLDSSSGIHARWSPYYIRNVRVNAHSPVLAAMREAGVPMDPENGQTAEDADTWVVHFPVQAPTGAKTRKDRTALEQCNYWLQVKQSYTEHNPSVTVTYQPDELLDLIRWVYHHQEYVCGMAFLPASDAKYDQMPYEEIGKREYERLASAFPTVDFSLIYAYEEEDMTTAAQELACMGGFCEL